MRNLKRIKIVSHGTAQSGNKLWYQLLPEGVICAYAAKGIPSGTPGYMQPALRAIQKVLTDEIDSHVTRAIDVTAVLPLISPESNVSRKIHYAKFTKQIDWCCICFVHDDVTHNTVNNGDVWCKQIVKVFKEKFLR